jgi:hypothetical protein
MCSGLATTQLTLVLACLSVLRCAVQEYVNGQLKNKYGDAFIRGNNGEPTGQKVAGSTVPVLAGVVVWAHVHDVDYAGQTPALQRSLQSARQANAFLMHR